ncbi:LVIVD repeat-containing protein [Geopsychrobacter electrodiphilus]|uniref:LVIVD repeat-containing protein n=1 Tax=Geopsychrobacter electrodiphilus TaxID=225196 RepID=UPI0003A7BBCB|nr:hypothetical protein [Geopsychrobacter electrodiphilus]
MKGLTLFRRTSFMLTLCLLILIGSCLTYLYSRGGDENIRVTDVTFLPAAKDNLVFGLEGINLKRHLSASLAHDVSNKRAIVGTFPVWGLATDIKVKHNLAYVITREEGVKVYNLKNPLSPEPIGVTARKANAWRMDPDEGKMFISSLTQGISISAMSLDAEPVKVKYEVSKAYSSIHRQHQLFVANGKSGLSIFDVTFQNKTTLLGRLLLPGNTVKLAFLGRYLLAASQRGGLHLIEVSDLEHPRILQSIDHDVEYENIIVIDNIVYASDKDLKIDLFSLENGLLRKLSSFPLMGNVREFLRDGSSLYLAESYFGLSKLDISDPQNPHRVGYVGVAGEANGLALYKGYLYVASRTQGVQIVDTRRIESRKVVASLDTPSDARDFVIDGKWIYVADGRAGLQIIDRGDQNKWRLVANLPSRYYATTLVKVKNLLYVAVMDQGLLVVDVRDPLAPRQVGQLTLDNEISDLAVRGSDLFVGCFDRKLLRINLSQPERPRVAETLVLPGKAHKIALQGDDIFIAADTAGLLVVQHKEGKPTRLIGQLTRPWPMTNFTAALGIAVRGKYAYLVLGEEGLQVVDISTPEHPVTVSNFFYPGWNLGVALSTDYAVLSSRWQGYFFIDITNPLKPFQIANIYSPRSTGTFKVEGDGLYVSGRSNGISLIPLPVRNIEVAGSKEQVISFRKPELAGWYDLNITDGKTLETTASVVRVD